MMRLEKSLHRVRFTPRSQANSDREVGPKLAPGASIAAMLRHGRDGLSLCQRCEPVARLQPTGSSEVMSIIALNFCIISG